MNHKMLLFVIMCCVVFLSGCWDEHAPERMYYLHSVGVDYKEDKYKVYYQIIDFAKVAKSEQPAAGAIQAEVGSATGRTLEEALFKLYRSMDERVYWGHLTYLVYSEDLLKNVEINTAIDIFNRYRDTRYQTWVYFTKEPVKDILLTTPILNKGITLSKLGDPKNSYSQESFVEPIDFRKLIIRLNEPSHEVAVPLIALKENWETEQEKNKITFLKGVGITTPNSFKGYLEEEQAYGLQWMTEETERGEVTVKVEADEGHYYTVVLNKLKVKVKSIVENGKVQFDIRIKMNAVVSAFPGNAKRSDIQKAVIEEVKKEVMDTYNVALEKDIDIYRLSEYLYRQNVRVWKEKQKDGKIPLTEESIRSLTVELTKLSSGRKNFTETIDK